MCSWQVSSLNESITNQILQLKPAQLVRFNQRQLLRVYPSNFRVDSSNFNPQPFWNAGCHLGLNYLFFFNLLWIIFFLIIIKACCFSLMMKQRRLWFEQPWITAGKWLSLFSQLCCAFVWNVVSSFQLLSTIKQKAVCYSWTGQNLQQMETAAMCWSQNACVKVRWFLWSKDKKDTFLWCVIFIILFERQFSPHIMIVLTGAFNPTLEDPLPGHRKSQLVLKIISGQQLPKPKDSMLGDRGEVSSLILKMKVRNIV